MNLVGVDGLEPTMSETTDLQSAAIATMRHPHFFIEPKKGLEPPTY